MTKATRNNLKSKICFGVVRHGDVFVKEKESDFVLKLFISKWKREQGINLNRHRKLYYVCKKKKKEKSLGRNYIRKHLLSK